MRVAWVTCGIVRGFDADEPIGVAAFEAEGAVVDVVDWHDADVEWSGYDRVVVRSAWDYTERMPQFLAWVDHVGTVADVRNRPEVLRWSADKRYLVDLAAAGVPVTPTTVAEPGEEPRLPSGEIVVKPVFGAGSRDAAWYAPDEHDLARGHVARLHARGAAALVQPRLAAAATHGERPLVFFDGVFSHAAAKKVVLPRAGRIDGYFAPEEEGPSGAADDELAVGRAALDAVVARFGAPPTYARVDLVRDDDGNPCVLELELVEPYLFLPVGDAAAPSRLVDAVLSPRV